jgi:hypothetical protein
MMSILHWSTKAAMHMPVSFVSAQLLSNMANYDKETQASGAGLLFFDVKLSFCASASDKLIAGGTFERRFSKSWQTFLAFPTATVRLLELKELHPGREIEDTVSKRPRPQLVGATMSAQADSENSATWEDFFWLWPAAGLIVVLSFIVAFLLLRRAKRSRDSERHWRDVAPAARLQQHQFEAQSSPQGPGGGTLAIVAHDFDPCSEDGSVFAAAAGLESSECLTANRDHLIEVFACGEGWLYGRLSGNGLFGYLPEPCVYWIDLNGANVVGAHYSQEQPNNTSRQFLREAATPPRETSLEDSIVALEAEVHTTGVERQCKA